MLKKHLQNSSQIFLFLFFISLVFICIQSKAQTAPDKYFIEFTDKNNSTFSIATPEQFLSQRAIQRRVRQNISIAENDLPVNQSYIDIVQSKGAVILTRTKWFNGITIFSSNPAIIDTIRNLPFVSHVSKIHKGNSAKNKEIENNKYPIISKELSIVDQTQQTTDLLNYGNSITQTYMVNGQSLHNLGYMGQGMVISIIDAGFNFANTLNAFDTLWQNNQILGHKDFVNSTNNLFVGTHSHGMNVLSIIAANLPGQIVGSAPKASFWLLHSEEGATEYIIEEDNWIAAAEFADSVGTDVINTSLGYSEFDDSLQNHTYAEMNGHTTKISRGVNIAFDKGMFVCIAAGNSGNSPWHYITTPGDADNALTVGAVDDSGNYASFSSVGPTSDGKIKPNVAAMGQGTYNVGTDGNVYPGNGTSFATPVITGFVTCLWQANPTYTNLQIKETIEQSASMYLTPDFQKGYGIPDFAMANLILKYTNSSNEDLVRTYPNPFRGNLSLELYSPDSQKVTIEIFNLIGVCVYSRNINLVSNSYNSILLNDLENLAGGSFILKATTQNKTYIQKIIKEL